LLGFLAINAILGGQTLSIASASTMSWNVGIVVVGIISLIVGSLYLCFFMHNNTLTNLLTLLTASSSHSWASAHSISTRWQCSLSS
jgi:hypothetical protein